MSTAMLSRMHYLSILDICQELGWHQLLVLGDGGGELTLLDGVQPLQLVHAHLELAGPLDLGQLPQEGQVTATHLAIVID